MVYSVEEDQEVAEIEEIIPITLTDATIHEKLVGSPILPIIEKRIKKYTELMCLLLIVFKRSLIV